MVSKIVITNLVTNVSVTFDRSDSPFLLDDDSPDWGDFSATDTTYPLLSPNIGLGVLETSLNAARQITIVGWVHNDDFGSIEDKKEFLNVFCNPFDELKIASGDYIIFGHFAKPVIYPSEGKLNNDCICKFMLYITCPFPLFRKQFDSSLVQSALTKSFIFPLALPLNNDFVFGYVTKSNVIAVNNIGTIATGFVLELRATSSVQGISVSVGDKIMKLKSGFTLLPGKVVKISTVGGSRGIWYGNVDGELNLDFSILDLQSDWVQLPVGLSNMVVNCESGSLTALGINVQFDCLYYAMEGQ